MAKSAKAAADKELDDLVSALDFPYANHVWKAPVSLSYRR